MRPLEVTQELLHVVTKPSISTQQRRPPPCAPLLLTISKPEPPLKSLQVVP